jgi:hypothetical protein
VTYYVYCWENLVTGLRYVGKGRGPRAFVHAVNAFEGRVGALPTAIRAVGIHNFKLTFLASGLSSAEALRIERESIYTLNTKWPAGYNMRGGVKPAFIGPRRRSGRPRRKEKVATKIRKGLFLPPHLRPIPPHPAPLSQNC